MSPAVPKRRNMQIAHCDRTQHVKELHEQSWTRDCGRGPLEVLNVSILGTKTRLVRALNRGLGPALSSVAPGKARREAALCALGKRCQSITARSWCRSSPLQMNVLCGLVGRYPKGATRAFHTAPKSRVRRQQVRPLWQDALRTSGDSNLTRAEVSRSRSRAGAFVLAAIVPEEPQVISEFTKQYLGPPNGSVTQLRRGHRCHWRRGATLAATNEMSAGSVCKRRDVVALGRFEPARPAGRRTARRQLL